MVLTKNINDAIDTLGETRAPVIGCIFNDATPILRFGGNSYGYGSYHSRYGGYYGKQETKQ